MGRRALVITTQAPFTFAQPVRPSRLRRTPPRNNLYPAVPLVGQLTEGHPRLAPMANGPLTRRACNQLRDRRATSQQTVVILTTTAGHQISKPARRSRTRRTALAALDGVRV